MSNKFYPHLFYNTSNLTIDEKKEILTYCNNLGKFNVDVLDTSKSFNRYTVDMSFSDILDKLDNSCHFVFIERRGYESWKGNRFFNSSWVIEVGFSTMNDPSYFLYIYVPLEYLDEIIDKFKLKLTHENQET